MLFSTPAQTNQSGYDELYDTQAGKLWIPVARKSLCSNPIQAPRGKPRGDAQLSGEE
jgi:hypothetical protein